MVSHADSLRTTVFYGKQAKSGLGIEAQRQAVARTSTAAIGASCEFTEIESGKRSDRPALDKALAAARVRPGALRSTVLG